MLPCLLDGDVILIQQEDHRLMMVALHHVHEAAQGLLHLDRRGFPVVDALEIAALSPREVRAVHQVGVLVVDIRDARNKRKTCSMRAGLSFVCQYGSYSNSIVAGGLPVQS